MLNKILLFSVLFINVTLGGFAHAAERVIDSVIATVDDKPITLNELSKRLVPARQITVEQLRTDQALRGALDNLILEKLLLAEAERKNIKVQDEDIDRYIDEVKQKNNLSAAEFEGALQKEHQTLATYKDRVRSEILKSRVAAASVKSTAAVTDDEVNTYITQKLKGESIHANGQQVHLLRILFPASRFTADEARQHSELFREHMKNGDEFKDAAASVSQVDKEPIVSDLGFVPMNDLDPEIVDAIHPLTTKELSHLVTTPEGFQVFQLIERKDGEKVDDNDDEDLQKKLEEITPEIRAQVRQKLESEKMEKKMSSFIDVELPTLHTIEKKF